MNNDSNYIQRCIELAKNGEGLVSPNPMVGAVIVRNGKIIGEGWHKQAGLPHAEVNAINSVADQSLLKESTIYVSLEPCSHHGKTPPCSNLIIEKQFKRVVIGCLDSNPMVSGKGIERIKNAGIEVEHGILEVECKELNSKFFTFHEKKRPFITLKWAQTEDGFIDKTRNPNEKGQFKISGPLAKTFVHKLRAEHDAILVGSNTAQTDNPSLTTYAFGGNSPIRIILDRSNKLTANLTLFNDENPTWHFTCSGEQVDSGSKRRIVLHQDDFIKNVLKYCFNNQVQSLLVEGGAMVLQQFIDADLWDEAIVITNANTIEFGKKAPKVVARETGCFLLEDDEIKIYSNDGISLT